MSKGLQDGKINRIIETTSYGNDGDADGDNPPDQGYTIPR